MHFSIFDAMSIFDIRTMSIFDIHVRRTLNVGVDMNIHLPNLHLNMRSDAKFIDSRHCYIYIYIYI